MKMRRITYHHPGGCHGKGSCKLQQKHSWGKRRKLGRPRDEPVWNWVGAGENPVVILASSGSM